MLIQEILCGKVLAMMDMIRKPQIHRKYSWKSKTKLILALPFYHHGTQLSNINTVNKSNQNLAALFYLIQHQETYLLCISFSKSQLLYIFLVEVLT